MKKIFSFIVFVTSTLVISIMSGCNEQTETILLEEDESVTSLILGAKSFFEETLKETNSEQSITNLYERNEYAGFVSSCIEPQWNDAIVCKNEKWNGVNVPFVTFEKFYAKEKKQGS